MGSTSWAVGAPGSCTLHPGCLPPSPLDGMLYSGTMNNFLGSEPILIRTLGPQPVLKTDNFLRWLQRKDPSPQPRSGLALSAETRPECRGSRTPPSSVLGEGVQFPPPWQAPPAPPPASRGASHRAAQPARGGVGGGLPILSLPAPPRSGRLLRGRHPFHALRVLLLRGDGQRVRVLREAPHVAGGQSLQGLRPGRGRGRGRPSGEPLGRRRRRGRAPTAQWERDGGGATGGGRGGSDSAPAALERRGRGQAAAEEVDHLPEGPAAVLPAGAAALQRHPPRCPAARRRLRRASRLRDLQLSVVSRAVGTQGRHACPGAQSAPCMHFT